MNRLAVALLFCCTTVFSQDLVIVEPLEHEVESWKLYSRGNDDPDEVDESGVGNYETAQVRATLLAGRNKKQGISVWFLYHAQLTSDDFGSTYDPQWKIKAINDNLTDSGLQTAKLVRSPSQGGRPRDTSLGVAAWLGVISHEDGLESVDGDYQGSLEIGIPSADEKQFVLLVQTIDWKLTVKRGKVISSSVDVRESDRKNKRPSNEILSLIRSSNPEDVLSPMFPTRIGKCLKKKITRRIGERNE